MSGHLNGNEHGRQLCDLLQAQLALLHPGVIGDQLIVSCGFHNPPDNRFAYIYHSKRKPSVQIYFRSDPGLPLNTLPDSVPVERREKLNGGWSHEFPFFLKLSDPAKVRDVALLLSEISYPLAVKKKTRNKRTARPETCSAEEVLSSSTYPEGAVQRILVNRYERDPRAREACIKRFGTICYLCGFDFASVYGNAMSGFIHVHHLKQLSLVGEGYEIDPIKDLRPVCPNCHAVLHRREPPYSLDDVASLLRANGGSPNLLILAEADRGP
jgi:hypothetical protein